MSAGLARGGQQLLAIVEMFEILEHTADIGFRTYGRTPAELFEAAAEALTSIVMERETVASRIERPLSAAGADYESLLVNWLSEVLYFIDAERMAFHHFHVSEITPLHVAGSGFGEPYDAARHCGKIIVKAVTYHQLKVTQTSEGWTAEVYLDV